MQLHQGLENSSPYRNGFVSIGNFDGVHVGHQTILSRLVELAHAQDAPAVVLTFEPHPIQLLRPGFAPPRLTTLKEKSALILSADVDHVVVYPTDETLLNLTAEEFFQQVVVDHFQAQGLVEGPNFFFGKDRSGTVKTLAQLCTAQGLSLNVLSPLRCGEEMTSSSAIRNAIQKGDVAGAANQLGRPYSISGNVTLGDQRGRTIGFPTANLSQIETLIPADGVYAAFAHYEDAHREDHFHSAAVNIGPNPTFGVETQKVEAHLLDFEGDLYGKELRLEMIQKVRSTKTFENAEQLTIQITQDIAKVRQILSKENL